MCACVCFCDSVCFEGRTRAPIREKEGCDTSEAGIALTTSSSVSFLFTVFFLSLSHTHRYTHPLQPPSPFVDRLSYTAPSVTGIPSRFHSNEVRGGCSLLAVVCNHHKLCWLVYRHSSFTSSSPSSLDLVGPASRSRA